MATVPAYRLSLEAKIGRQVFGHMADHLCEHPWCVNPDHLEFVPVRVNCIRSIRHKQLHEARIQRGLPPQSPVPGMRPSGHMTF